MGIPYSREINAAFEQVTPLVAAGFQVLKTTRNISILLAIIQVLTVLLLGLILGVLVALVYVLDPGLEVRGTFRSTVYYEDFSWSMPVGKISISFHFEKKKKRLSLFNSFFLSFFSFSDSIPLFFYFFLDLFLTHIPSMSATPSSPRSSNAQPNSPSGA